MVLQYRAPQHRFRPRWSGMIQRCYNPKDRSYSRYGGRGIWVCKAWRSYRVFHAWAEKTFEEGLVLDRKRNSGPYSPTNCRWVTPMLSTQNRAWTPKQQLARKKLAQNIFHTVYGNPRTRIKKYCPVCTHTLKLNFFSKCSSAPDGLQGYCRACIKK